MLVLTRRKDESIIFADNIEMRVLRISRHQVKIGIEAPRSIPVYRKEIYEAVRDTNSKRASDSDPSDPLVDELGAVSGSPVARGTSRESVEPSENGRRVLTHITVNGRTLLTMYIPENGDRSLAQAEFYEFEGNVGEGNYREIRDTELIGAARVQLGNKLNQRNI